MIQDKSRSPTVERDANYRALKVCDSEVESDHWHPRASKVTEGCILRPEQIHDQYHFCVSIVKHI